MRKQESRQGEMGVVDVRTFVTVESEINYVYVWANSHDMFCIYESPNKGRVVGEFQFHS